MKTTNKLSGRVLALIAAAVLLFTAGTAIGTRAQLQIFSENYNAEFELDHLDVALVENDTVTPEQLIQYMNGTFVPGKEYEERIAAQNRSDVKEYVRLTLRVYWMKELEDGSVVKDTSLDPSLIELTYNGEPYNSGAWQINDAETTRELRTFYLNKVLEPGAFTDPVVNELRVSDKILDDMTVHEDTESVPGKTIYTYEYKYDGSILCVEADVQSLQHHNVNDAIQSLWGVQNVTVSGETVTVSN